MKSYRIVLEYTEDSNPNGIRIVNPAQWSWPTILDLGPDEVVTLVSSQIIDTPQSHARQLAGIEDVEEIMQDGLGQDAVPDDGADLETFDFERAQREVREWHERPHWWDIIDTENN